MGATVIGLARYPVKSMTGETCESVGLEERGLVGDRLWAVRAADGKLGSGKDTRRFRRIDGLLDFSAVLDGDVPVITTPAGEQLRAGDPAADARLSELLGRSVTLAREGAVAHMDTGAVSLTTTGSLRALGELLGDDHPVDVRRFRKNLLLEDDEPWAEEELVGREFSVGSARLRVDRRIERCRMVDLAQRDLPEDGRILRILGAHRDLCLGVYADVVRPGTVTLGAWIEV